MKEIPRTNTARSLTRRSSSQGRSQEDFAVVLDLIEAARTKAVVAVNTTLIDLYWSHHLAIMSRCKRDEEREFYLRLARRERWSFRELQRQLAGALFERTVLSPAKLSTPLAELHPEAAEVFKDIYLLEFYQLAESQAEASVTRDPQPSVTKLSKKRKRPTKK